MIVIADTGPLLALAKIGALDLLQKLYQQVITGPAVYAEAVTAGLAMSATAAIDQVILPKQAIELIRALKGRPDVWLAPSLCDAVIQTLQNLP